MRPLLLLTLVFLFGISSAQNQKIDSLKNLMLTENDDSLRLEYEKSWGLSLLQGGQLHSADSILQGVAQKAKQKNWGVVEHRTIDNLANIQKLKSNYDSAEKGFQKAYEYFNIHHQYVYEANSLYNLGIVNYYQGQIERAFENWEQAYKVGMMGKDTAAAINYKGSMIQIKASGPKGKELRSEYKEYIKVVKSMKQELPHLTARINYSNYLFRHQFEEEGLSELMDVYQDAEKAGAISAVINVEIGLGLQYGRVFLHQEAYVHSLSAYKKANSAGFLQLKAAAASQLSVVYQNWAQEVEGKFQAFDSMDYYGNIAIQLYRESNRKTKLMGSLSNSVIQKCSYIDSVEFKENYYSQMEEQFQELSTLNQELVEKGKPSDHRFNHAEVYYLNHHNRLNELIPKAKAMLQAWEGDKGRLAIVKNLTRFLSEAYFKKGDLLNAEKYSRMYNENQDLWYNQSAAQMIKGSDLQYQTAKKDAENQELKAKSEKAELKASNAILQKRTYGALGLAALLIGLVLALLFNRKNVRIQNELNMEREKFERQMEQSENKNLQAILDALESDRIRIAQDLHDRIGAGISTAKLYFEGIKDLLQKDKSKLENNFQKVDEVLTQSLEEVRNVSRNMTNGVLADFGLVPAISDLKETIEATGKIIFNFEENLEGERLERNQEINLYRIIQELVGNTIKHAEAGRIETKIQRSNNILNIEYLDNGIGYNILENSQGLGLQNIVSRMSKLGGEVINQSEVDKGCQFILQIPI